MSERIGFVGLGTIAQHHISALERIPSVDVVGGSDIDQGRILVFRGRSRPVLNTIEELVELNPSLVLVATPTRTHFEVCSQIISVEPPQRLVVEKPLAASADEVFDLLDLAEGLVDVSCVYHAAHGPEVVWAAERISKWTSRFGFIQSFDMHFADPYYTMDRSVRDLVYVNSWFDSGINALSVALRFVPLVGSRLVRRGDDHGSLFQAEVTFQIPEGVGIGRIETSWRTDIPAKWSTFTFESGTQLMLDHQAMKGSLHQGRVIMESFAYGAGLPRLTAHYVNAFRSLLGEGEWSYKPAQTRQLHELLFRPLT